MTPAFRVMVAGQDVTGSLADRLLSLTVTDEDGGKADRVEIEVDDRQGRVALPDMNAKLEISLGYRGRPLALMGVYAVDGISGASPPQVMRISATAADLKGDIRSPKTRAWENKTLSEIVKTIAGEAALKPVVGKSVAQARWKYLAQQSESDLAFLTRIAGDLDATAKPTTGALIVQRRGDGLTAAGDVMPVPMLMGSNLTDWDWSIDAREIYKKVEAPWSVAGSGNKGLAVKGDGKPVLRLRHSYGSPDEAARAAEAKLKGAARSAMTLKASLARFEPGLLAGASVVMAMMPRLELNGVWHIATVQHELTSGGLVTSFTTKKGAPE